MISDCTHLFSRSSRSRALFWCFWSRSCRQFTNRTMSNVTARSPYNGDRPKIVTSCTATFDVTQCHTYHYRNEVSITRCSAQISLMSILLHILTMGKSLSRPTKQNLTRQDSPLQQLLNLLLVLEISKSNGYNINVFNSIANKSNNE